MTETNANDRRERDSQNKSAAPTAPICSGCGDELEPGERVLRVEAGEQTPYGMTPADASDEAIQHYHEGCVSTGLGGTDDG